jgi:uncharacterized glyoxalase superfamily protein PhnB
MSEHGTGIVVCPVRFTDRIEAMREFLMVLGLAPRVESERGGWVDLVAGGGMVALHEASSSDLGALPGETTLSFEVDDADAVAESLRSAGFADAHVHDENYGRALTVTDPLGDLILLNERSGDLYGYRMHDPDRCHPGTRVVPVRFTDEAMAYARFLNALGLRGEPDPSYAQFAAAEGDHGSVGVHHVFGEDLPVVPGPGGTVQLTLTATEDLQLLVERLRKGGYDDAEVVQEDFGSLVSVTDPDGQSVRVHELPRL